MLRHYRADGDAAFTPRSRRPQTSSTRLAQSKIEVIIAHAQMQIERIRFAGFASCQDCHRYFSRSTRLRILPDGLRGIASAKITFFGNL